jgi:hypothetical protein
MKSKEFGLLLQSFCDLLESVCADRTAADIRKFAEVFNITPTSTILALTKRLSSVPIEGHEGTPNLGDIIDPLLAFNSLMRTAAKATTAKDVDLVVKLAREYRSFEIHAFLRMATEAASAKRSAKRKSAAQPREDVINFYLETLQSSIGNEHEFRSAYKELSEDKSLTKDEAATLTKQIAGTAARSKADALKKILNMHKSLVIVKSKARATGGRSAA